MQFDTEDDAIRMAVHWLEGARACWLGAVRPILTMGLMAADNPVSVWRRAGHGVKVLGWSKPGGDTLIVHLIE